MKLPVLTREGKPTGREVELDASVFGIEPNEHVMYLAVKVQRARMRQGTHASRNRSRVRGGGAKPWRQKGRGVARAGTNSSPLWRHGGTIFGPQPHPYIMRLPHKVNRLARAGALATRAAEEAIRLVEDFTLDAPRTKEVTTLLRALELENEKVLILTLGYDKNLVRSTRNLPLCDVRVAVEASTYDLLNHRVLLLMEGALEPISEVLGGQKRRAQEAA
ncbi:MAG TPA: 50S ribosomal protein L4 [Bacteroidetes bacterium]|nr:50S ribosomal protein L4 [Bacteroidota bacterium]